MLETLKREEPGDSSVSPTFAACAAQYIELRRQVWTGRRQVSKWTASLEKHAFPHIGPKPVDQITESDIVAVLDPIWLAMPTTGSTLRRQIGAVMGWAAAQGYRDGCNPAGQHILNALPQSRRPVKHYPYLPYAEIPAALQRMELSSSRPPTRLVFRLIVLTAARPGEVRFGEWSEINWVQRTWTVPAARMTTRQEHRVPLSNQVMRLLADAWDLSGSGGLIFPGKPGGDAVGNGTLHCALRRLDIPAVPYGFRNSFYDWCSLNNVPHELIEASLSRTTGGDSAEATFLRSDLFDQRKPLMQQWADFCMPDYAPEKGEREEQAAD